MILLVGTKQTGSATASHRSCQTTGRDDFDDDVDDAIPGLELGEQWPWWPV